TNICTSQPSNVSVCDSRPSNARASAASLTAGHTACADRASSPSYARRYRCSVCCTSAESSGCSTRAAGATAADSIAGRACNCGCTCACGITIGVAGGTIGSGGAGGGGLGTAAAGISVPSELVGCVGCGLTSTVTSVGTLPPLVATAEPSCDGGTSGAAAGRVRPAVIIGRDTSGAESCSH